MSAAVADDRLAREFYRRTGHPIGLAVLFLTEMWERFSYYGMRGLLKLYMVNYLFVAARRKLQGEDSPFVIGNPDEVWGWPALKSFLLSGDPSLTTSSLASTLYGWYIGLVYFTPVLGGILADRYLGQRKTVIVGGVVMAIGHFVMAIDNAFFPALILLILGNGAFKPNISTQVGNLYPDEDPRRDRAFSIFYVGINLGAFICNFVCGTLAAVKGWHWGFGAAGVGMVLGLMVYVFGQRYLAPDEKMRSKEAEAEAEAKAENVYRTAASGGAEKMRKHEWLAVAAIVILALLNIPFWGVYEQGGNTMQTWADEQTAWPTVFGWQIPSTWYQSFNPFLIFALTPLLNWLWAVQARKGTEPSSATKMAIGSFLMGASFVIMAIGAQNLGTAKGSLTLLFLNTVILTAGELYISPIGLSFVTKVSPKRLVSAMMGVWFLLSSAVAGPLSGWLGTFYDKMTHANFFWLMTAIGFGTGVAMLILHPPIKKFIGNV